MNRIMRAGSLAACRRTCASAVTRSTGASTTMVIGAGPAGITAVGWLLSRKQRVIWVDPSFSGGALDSYRDVPANTKVDVLSPVFSGAGCFLPDGLPDGAPVEALDRMRDSAKHLPGYSSDPAELGWTGLDKCHDLFCAVTNSLMERHARGDGTLQIVHGRVNALKMSEHHGAAGRWSARLHGAPSEAFELFASNVVLATGALPNHVPTEMHPSSWACSPIKQPRILSVDHALQLETLRRLVQPHETVGVIGGGHTGVVLTLLLTESLGVSTHLFIRRPIQLAQWDRAAESYAAWAFRGLKGAAASYAQRRGLVGSMPPNGPVALPSDAALSAAESGSLELHHVDRLIQCSDTGKNLDAVIFCLGFGAPPIPTILSSSGAVVPQPASHQHPGGALLDDDGHPIAGLYGVGLGFADNEFTSGRPYAEAGFAPFAARAAEIAAAISAPPQSLPGSVLRNL